MLYRSLNSCVTLRFSLPLLHPAYLDHFISLPPLVNAYTPSPPSGNSAVGRATEDLLAPPSVPPKYNLDDLSNRTVTEGVASYNVNGPGSASYRFYLFTVTTSADDVDEVQRVGGRVGGVDWTTGGGEGHV